MNHTETIAAIATPPGRGGVGIIRVSGPNVLSIAKTITQQTLKPRIATYTLFYDMNHDVIDQGIALFFKGPNSFTGEDVLELQGHGGPVIMDILLQAVLNTGDIRIARAGEFSERAFLNDKLDLAQAEAIADLIDASSEQAARSAVNSLQGQFSNKIHHLVESLIHCRLYVEAALDFPEEEIDFLQDKQLLTMLHNCQQELHQVQQSAQQGVLLKEGITLAIIGKPNAGKSSLLNALAGKESAIVTDIAGTTRDTIKEHINLNGIPVHIIDTAGLRKTDDQVEKIGVERAKKAMHEADHLLLVVDQQDEHNIANIKQNWLKDLSPKIPLTIVINKIDQQQRRGTGPAPTPHLGDNKGITTVSLSAKTNQGLNLLTDHLLKTIGAQSTTEGNFIARRRHCEALNQAATLVDLGIAQLEQHRAGELLADDLSRAQKALSEITGEFTSDDLLGRIFSSFCIGK